MIREDIIIRMQQAGELIDVSNPVYLRAEGVSRLPRVLDKPPRPIKLKTLDGDDQYGCASEFIMLYQQLYDGELATARIKVNDKVKLCDPRVYFILRCLALSSTHCIDKRAIASAEMFKYIMTSPCEVLTEQVVYERLSKFNSKEYYPRELKNAVWACLFSKDAVTRSWIMKASDHNFYTEASRLGVQFLNQQDFTIAQLKEFIETNWKDARADTEFMKKIVKSYANKWMTAMIYHLYKSNSGVLSHGNPEDGFMEV